MEVFYIKKVIIIVLILFIAFAIIGYRMVMSGDAQKLFDNPREFLFKEGIKIYNRSVQVDLYFLSESEDKLVLETVNIDQTLKNLPAAVFELLAEGAQNKDLNPVIPPGTELLWAKTDDNICTLNFTQDFLIHIPKDGVKERLTVYAIVNSITSIDGIEYVKFLIDSKEYDKLYSVKVKEPLAPDHTLVIE